MRDRVTAFIHQNLYRVPTRYMRDIFPDGMEEYRLDSGDALGDDGYPIFGICYVASNPIINAFLECNVQKLEDMGFCVFYDHEHNIIISIDSSGYNMLDREWTNLYNFWLTGLMEKYNGN